MRDAAERFRSRVHWGAITSPLAFTCRRCGAHEPTLAKAPLPGAWGQTVLAQTCADCWREWIGMGTKVINELRLPLNDPRAQKEFDRHMFEFLNLKPD